MEPITTLSAIMIIAFLGSVGHCVGMCGGFVVAYSSAKVPLQLSKEKVLGLHFLYNIGRVISYALLGFIFGAFGSIFTILPEFHGILLLVAAILMLFSALSLVGKSGFLLSVEQSLSTFGQLKKGFNFLIKSSSPLSFLGLGILNGFFPCGFVYFFAISAAATASALEGALVMTVFGLSTIPVMMTLGSSVSLLRRFDSIRPFLTKIAALSIALYACATFYFGLAYFFDLPL